MIFINSESKVNSRLFSVINGHRPANLDPRVKPVDDSKVECVASGNNGYRWRLFSGYKYPSPDTTVSTSPARGEVLNNITFKGLDVVRQYVALLERHVQSSTRVRKVQAVTRQTNPIGRSMIEMLGVLAIIAVLSVGGIAGYSKAMAMWRSNIQRNMISELIASTIKMKPNLDAFDQKYNMLNSVIYAMGDMPEGLEYKDGLFYDKNGVDMNVMQGHSTWTDQNGNVTGGAQRLIIFFRYSQGDGNSSLSAVDLCRNIIEAAKPVANEVLMINFWEAVDTSISWREHKDKTLYTGQTLKNAEISDIMQKCKMNFAKGGNEQFLLYLNPY